MDQGHFFHQPRAMEPEGARHLLDHCHICLQRCRQHPGLCGAGPLLRPTPERDNGHSERHLYRLIRLRYLRRYAPHLCLARRRSVLEHASHRQDSPGAPLARDQELQTFALLLVQLRRDVRLRVLPSIHIPLAQFGLYPLPSFDARYRREG